MRLLALQLRDRAACAAHGHDRRLEACTRRFEYGHAAALRDARTNRRHARAAERDGACAGFAHGPFAFGDDAIDDRALAAGHLRHHTLFTAEATEFALGRNVPDRDAVTILEAAATFGVDVSHRLRPDRDDRVRPAARACGAHRGFAGADHRNPDGRTRRLDAVVRE